MFLKNLRFQQNFNFRHFATSTAKKSKKPQLAKNVEK